MHWTYLYVTIINRNEIGKKQAVYVAFIDIKNVYDSVPKIKLLKFMKETGIHKGLVNSVQ